jgi:hypothetical protein
MTQYMKQPFGTSFNPFGNLSNVMGTTSTNPSGGAKRKTIHVSRPKKNSLNTNKSQVPSTSIPFQKNTQGPFNQHGHLNTQVQHGQHGHLNTQGQHGHQNAQGTYGQYGYQNTLG